MCGIRIKITGPVYFRRNCSSRVLPLFRQNISKNVWTRTLKFGLLIWNDESITWLTEVLRKYASCNIMIMKSCQQDIPKTIWAKVGPWDLVCLHVYGIMSRFPDRPDRNSVDWTAKPNQTNNESKRNDKSTKHFTSGSGILGKVLLENTVILSVWHSIICTTKRTSIKKES